MHTKQQVLDRLDKIAALVDSKDDEAVAMDSWLNNDHPECGTICCALGWAAADRLFGDELVMFNFAEMECIPADRHGNYGYDAAATVLFGVNNPDDLSIEALDVVEFLFCPVQPDALVSDKDAFLGRAAKAKQMIASLYDDDAVKYNCILDDCLCTPNNKPLTEFGI